VSSWSRYKSRIQSIQETHYASLKTEFEKLRNDTEEVLRELSYEIVEPRTTAKDDVINCCIVAMFAVGLLYLAF
ncbi:hypothetical protein FRX31_035130, partial [Thalictrum thalictroides]